MKKTAKKAVRPPARKVNAVHREREGKQKKKRLPPHIEDETPLSKLVEAARDAGATVEVGILDRDAINKPYVDMAHDPQQGWGEAKPDFWANVAIGHPDDCWEWQGTLNPDGYGLCSRGLNVGQIASRAAWRLTHGEIPEGLSVLHRCDNRACCNPYHLYLGTHTDNMRDMVERARQARGVEVSTSKLTKDQVRAIRADPRSQRKIAADYGIAQNAVYLIKAGKNWGWLD